MELSLSVLRHRLSARRQALRPVPAVERPEGRLLWAHLTPGDRVGAMMALERLERLHPDLTLLVTGEPVDGRLHTPTPADTRGAAAFFLGHWRPDLAVFFGEDLFPSLWKEALALGIPLIAAEADPARYGQALVAPMSQFDAVLTVAPDPRLGGVVEVVEPLSRVPALPFYDPERIEELGVSVATRPLWLATGVPEAELSVVIEAHRRASQGAHRLLLVLEDLSGRAEQRFKSQNWLVSRDDLPCLSDQVLLIRDQRDLGAWLHLAPITYLGGTLVGSGPNMPPFWPASLGSAIILGPRTTQHAEQVEGIWAGRAAELIDTPRELGAAVERLNNPERAAALAARGWQVTDAGALATQTLLELIDDTLAGVPI
ncbi:3-deoxy-D-manno-octulosonic acid transferase [Palleronia caenipelagi]|uniref:3-deoxy-D-manno-octulosonic acid transferase n=1 Tax=Palleronia caenipelagi TaxID=2489174 RepID=A0A547Q8A4_9RHOB|nr:glycosyltransferase N-terminal domain-containing protein [Palleronia caenipelagi]TRD22599.1 hypothetical protein FEV53_04070 [Palleronia caenipelagi]